MLWCPSCRTLEPMIKRPLPVLKQWMLIQIGHQWVSLIWYHWRIISRRITHILLALLMVWEVISTKTIPELVLVVENECHVSTRIAFVKTSNIKVNILSSVMDISTLVGTLLVHSSGRLGIKYYSYWQFDMWYDICGLSILYWFCLMHEFHTNHAMFIFCMILPQPS